MPSQALWPIVVKECKRFLRLYPENIVETSTDITIYDEGKLVCYMARDNDNPEAFMHLLFEYLFRHNKINLLQNETYAVQEEFDYLDSLFWKDADVIEMQCQKAESNTE